MDLMLKYILEIIKYIDEEKGVLVLKNEYIKKFVDRFIKFGNMSAKNAISIIFYLGVIPIFTKAIQYGKMFIYTNNIVKEVWDKSSIKMVKTGTIVQEKTYMVQGIFRGLLYFIIMLIIWKIICELSIKIFRCFEVYVDKNKGQ